MDSRMYDGVAAGLMTIGITIGVVCLILGAILYRVGMWLAAHLSVSWS